jgi:hypothetical protein
MITIDELEEFYYQSGEDWHLWDDETQGPYPVQRMLDAMKTFLERAKLKEKDSVNSVEVEKVEEGDE